MGSYSGSNSGTFNPASYTRHFLGSPISWRAGSFGARFPQGSPTAQLLNSIDSNDFKHPTKMSSSIDSDRGSLINAFNIFEREGELCRNYTCCGLHLQDLHALLEHFEEVHILVIDPNIPAQIHVPFNPQCISPQQQQSEQQPPLHHLPHQPQLPQQHRPTFDSSDDMEFDLDLDSSTQSIPPTPAATSSRSSPSSNAPTPPRTPISAPLSAYPSPTVPPPALAYLQPQSQYHGHGHQVQVGQFAQFPGPSYTSAHTSPYTSQPPSPGALNVNSLPIHPHMVSGGPFPHHLQQQPNVVARPEEAFNTYARFSTDYSSQLPGAQYNGTSRDDQVVAPEYSGAAVVGEYSSPATPQGYLGQGQGMDVQQGQGQQIPGTQAQQQGPQCIPPALLFGSGERKAENAGRRDVHAARPPRSGVSSPQPLQKVRLKIRDLGGGELATRSTPSTPTTISPSHTPNPSSTSTSASTSTSRDGQNQVQVSTSSLLLRKPFRCPKPNCNKSYKQANGLKYHQTHGSCNFAPPKDLEHVKDLLERKRREREARESANTGEGNSTADSATGLSRSASMGSIGTKAEGANTGSPPSTSAATNSTPNLNGIGNSNDMSYSDLAALGSITETELREVEKEAEKRLRPFACSVGDCQRRYKNMNGLRYHYQHSGDHGAVGLALLAGGLHECLSGNHNNNSSNHTGGFSSSSADQSTTSPNANHQDNKGKGKPYAHNIGMGLGLGLGVYGHGGHEDREREGRKRALYMTAAAGGRGSASVPVSRAASVVGASRVGTPVQVQGQGSLASGYSNANTNASGGLGVSAGGVNGGGNVNANGGTGGGTSPPLTPLTAAVQGLGLGGKANTNVNGAGSRSQPHSPTGSGFLQQQAQAQVQYQQQFLELQRRQYFQQAAHARQAIQQQQQELQHNQDVYAQQQEFQQQETYVQQQQQEFHPEFQPTQQNEFHPPQLQEYHLAPQSQSSQPQSPSHPEFHSTQGEYCVAVPDFQQQQVNFQQHQQQVSSAHQHQQQHHDLGLESFDAQAQQEFVEAQRVQAERAQKQRELEQGFQQHQHFGVGMDVAMV